MEGIWSVFVCISKSNLLVFSVVSGGPVLPTLDIPPTQLWAIMQLWALFKRRVTLYSTEMSAFFFNKSMQELIFYL